MKKLSNQQVFLVVVALGVALCLVVYSLVFTKYNDMTSQLKDSNAQLQATVDELKGYYDNMAVYKKQQAEMLEDIETKTADYPGDAREEDVIMMAVGMQSAAIINYEGISIGTSDVIHTIPAETVAAAGTEDYKEQIDFVEKRATYSNYTDYGNLKNCIAKIYESPYRVGINAIAYSKNSETDTIISGTIDITYYSLRGMNKTYTLPEMPEYMGGVSELFGILEDEGGNTVAPEADGADAGNVQIE